MRRALQRHGVADLGEKLFWPRRSPWHVQITDAGVGGQFGDVGELGATYGLAYPAVKTGTAGQLPSRFRGVEPRYSTLSVDRSGRGMRTASRL